MNREFGMTRFIRILAGLAVAGLFVWVSFGRGCGESPLDNAMRLLDMGTQLVQRGELAGACNCWSNALKVFANSESNRMDAAACHANIGAALLRIGQPEEGLHHTKAAMSIYGGIDGLEAKSALEVCAKNIAETSGKAAKSDATNQTGAPTPSTASRP